LRQGAALTADETVAGAGAAFTAALGECEAGRENIYPGNGIFSLKKCFYLF
jgi:hypothetical protein